MVIDLMQWLVSGLDLRFSKISTVMIRFSARGAYLLLALQGRALIRDRALIQDSALI